MEYPKPHHVQIDRNAHSLSYTADLRAVHLLKHGDRYWVLSEAAPDAAFSYDDDANIALTFLNVGGSQKETDSISEGSEDLPLTGRASYVLLARELLYRLNEMAYNTQAGSGQIMTIYAKILDVIKDVAKTEASNISYDTKVNMNAGVSSSISRQDNQSSKIISRQDNQNSKIISNKKDATITDTDDTYINDTDTDTDTDDTYIDDNE